MNDASSHAKRATEPATSEKLSHAETPDAAVRQPLTEAQIEHLWDTRVGYPTATRPLGIRDVLLFARAIELAHGITGAQE